MGIICSEKEQQTTKHWFRGGSEEEGTWERSKIEKLRKEKETLNLELSLVEKEKVNLESKVSKIKSDLGTAEKIIRELSTELKTAREKNDELKRKYNYKYRPRLDGEDGRSEEENQNSINELELRVKGQSEALSDLKLQLEKSEKKYNKEKSALVKRCEELESLVGTEKARVESIWELEKTEMGRTLANLRNQVVQLENHKLMKESLEKEFNLLLREKETWDSEKLEYDVNLDKLEEKLTYRNRILEQSQSEVLQLKSQISELKKKLENFEAERSSLSSEISTLNQKLSVSEEKLKCSERSKDEHENIFSEYKQKCEGYEIEVGELRRSISTKESLIIQLEAKLNKMTAELNDIKSTLKSQSTTNLESQADEITSLKEQLTDAYSARTKAEQKLTEVEGSEMSLQERLNRQQKTNKILEERCYSTETILRYFFYKKNI
ncbi:intracellular protein transport protein USO1-like [Eurytemora carolleeae]|uniref:intracellular protein transport protein USO1-like n=1 Tax=Eurytemora carolleeae TaxID=1294199 RepID=UPI000C79525D|nr:intracellular protein transport protein USO1-like [Eurytemora carolleeae]|eukprot:XP_023322434.1 intracellular protein transport protein USO1-like [Eurytemora affinis]